LSNTLHAEAGSGHSHEAAVRTRDVLGRQFVILLLLAPTQPRTSRMGQFNMVCFFLVNCFLWRAKFGMANVLILQQKGFKTAILLHKKMLLISLYNRRATCFLRTPALSALCYDYMLMLSWVQLHRSEDDANTQVSTEILTVN